MAFTIFDIIGSTGVALIIITYLLLQLEKIKSTQFLYSLLNGIGSILIMISLILEFNFSAFIIEFFWLIISIVGIIKYLYDKKEGNFRRKK